MVVLAAAVAGVVVADASARTVGCGSAPTNVYPGAFRVRATGIACGPARNVARKATNSFYTVGPGTKTVSFVLARRTWDCEAPDFSGTDVIFHVLCRNRHAVVAFTGGPQGD